MADDLNMTSGRPVADDKIVLPPVPDPRVMLASIVHDFKKYLGAEEFV
jgi:hypothetical protein